MAITAENLAEQFNVSRDDADAYGHRSQETWAAPTRRSFGRAGAGHHRGAQGPDHRTG